MIKEYILSYVAILLSYNPAVMFFDAYGIVLLLIYHVYTNILSLRIFG